MDASTPDNNECPICFVSAPLQELPCNSMHKLCLDCLVKIQSEVYVMRNCPFCRTRISVHYIPPGCNKEQMEQARQQSDYRPHTIEDLNLTNLTPHDLIFAHSDPIINTIRVTNPQNEQFLDNLVNNFRGMNRERHRRNRRHHVNSRPRSASHDLSSVISLPPERRKKRRRPRYRKSKKQRQQAADKHHQERRQDNLSRAPTANPNTYRYRHHNRSRYGRSKSRSVSPVQNRTFKT